MKKDLKRKTYKELLLVIRKSHRQICLVHLELARRFPYTSSLVSSKAPAGSKVYKNLVRQDTIRREMLKNRAKNKSCI